MRQFYIKTFGCQMNKNDSDIIHKILSDCGYLPAESLTNAEVLIVNTCIVRRHAEERALGYIATLKKWREKNGKILGVVGCMTKHLKGEIIAKFPFVDFVLGPDSYRKIPEYLDLLNIERTKIVDIEKEDELYSRICRTSDRVSEFVSITRGCNNYCSYCIVPYVRGRLRSKPIVDIIGEVKGLVACGVKEITLLGQNVNEYYHNGVDFLGVLRRIAVIPGLLRIRFLTSHPKDFNEGIIDLMKENGNICEWFHLPLQTANNRILDLMNRGYKKDDYLKIIKKIRSEIPEATVTTDVIVGFPTETEEEFLETLDFISQIEFDDAYMYRYSARPYTSASRLPTLPEEVIKSRLAKLIKVQGEITNKKTKAMLGKEYEVLFEEKIEDGMRGKTRGNKDVIVRDKVKLGGIYRVKVVEIRGRTPIGKIIQ